MRLSERHQDRRTATDTNRGPAPPTIGDARQPLLYTLRARGATPPDARTGLVSERISAHAPPTQVVVCPAGVEMHCPTGGVRPGRGGTRDVVRGMSSASSRRLKQLLIRVPYNEVTTYLAGVTYHHNYAAGPAKWKADLRTFGRALGRDWASFEPGMIWRLEFQRRGAPHYHLLLFFRRPPAWGQLVRWLDHTWNAIAEPGNDVALDAGCNLELVRLDERGGAVRLVFYLTKYLSKRGQGFLLDPETGELCKTGRTWGHILTIPQTELASFTLDESQRVILARRLRRWGQRSRYISRIGKRYNGATLIVDPRAFGQLLRGIDDEHARSLAQATRGP